MVWHTVLVSKALFAHSHICDCLQTMCPFTCTCVHNLNRRLVQDAYNFIAFPYQIEAILRFLGISDIETIRAEGIAYGPEQDQAAMASASEQIDAVSAAA